MSRYTDKVWYCTSCDTYAAKADDVCRCLVSWDEVEAMAVLDEISNT